MMNLSRILVLVLLGCTSQSQPSQNQPPNILLVISDDQSYPHASAYRYSAISTPGFDRVAREGVLFTQAFAASPGCSPSRASLLTGRHCWQLEHAGTHASSFAAKYRTYPELLQQRGYHTGFTGKGWGPGNYQAGGRDQNPAGPAWQQRTLDTPEGISDRDYAGNFADFLDARSSGQPFCFWMGGHEPHRVFKQGIGLDHGLDSAKVVTPGFLPDQPEIRSDILDYCYEIQWFDQHLQRALQMLEERNLLDNTLIIVTADNGMAFPRAKANVYEYGIHVPLAIRWGDKVSGGRTVNDLVGFVDLAPTILEVTEVPFPSDQPMSGRSLVSMLTSGESGIIEDDRTAVFASRERHSSSRYHSLGYPQRSLRTHDYLYIRNFKPERWPSGAPQKYGTANYLTLQELETAELGPMHGGYHDIDACPSLDFMVRHVDDPVYGHFLEWTVAKRPAEELFDIKADPACLNNLATDANYKEVKQQLADQLIHVLEQTGDPRLAGQGDIWETYPRYSRLRKFPEPDWARENPASIPRQDWLEEHWKDN